MVFLTIRFASGCKLMFVLQVCLRDAVVAKVLHLALQLCQVNGNAALFMLSQVGSLFLERCTCTRCSNQYERTENDFHKQTTSTRPGSKTKSRLGKRRLGSA